MDEKAPVGRPRGGRPISAGPKQDKSGLGSILSARITNELRNALEKEADRTGRSISQIAERWMDEARAGHAALHQIAGGYDLVPAFERMGDAARRISEEAPDPSWRRDAIETAWSKIIAFAIPQVGGPFHVEAESAREELRIACSTLLTELSKSKSDDPVRLAAESPAVERTTGLLHSFQAAPRIVNVVFDCAESGEVKDLDGALERLADAGSTVRHEIEAARRGLVRLNEANTALMAHSRTAAARGCEIAYEVLDIPRRQRAST